MKRASDSTVQLGLEANWKQFVLLVVINGFVGAMVGLERTVVPLIAEKDFGIVSGTAALSFIISFGVVKALLNLFAGVFADRFGRKRLLVIGWIIGLPVPGLIILAPEWSWVILANILLGINQGLCWSTTVIMKIDLVGAKRRGMAMGLNEFAGYVAVSLSALATGYLASVYGMRPYPFYPGIAFAAIGLILSIFFVRDTQAHARTEAQQHRESLSRLEENQLQSEEWTKSSFQPAGSERLHQPKQPPELTQFQDRASLGQVLLETSYRHRDLFSASQAGVVD
ncbi:MAG: MFS transporter, partial [candidate division Zixibacteria bacterium]|nr:MFS transporter [candidate division Zixibacteria bacterium]NIW41428.1 MFS transporter [candidate division Zixibacteria bacterium]NIW97316.1 MFS transporter [Phycisphaerae bacterium]